MILYTIPSKSVRLLAKRVVSFVVDLAVLALFTYAVVDLLYKVDGLRPSAALSMVIVWAWFLYFIIFDWQFAGAPGKLIVGLRLKNAGSGISGFVKCLLRSLVTLIVPVAIAGRITAIPVASKTTEFMLWSAALALLAFQPLSVAFSGGQSVPDLLLRTGVFPKNAGLKEYPASLNRRSWLVLVSASLIAGLFLAYSAIPGIGGRFAEIISPIFPGARARTSGEAEARVAAVLRMSVLKDAPDTRDVVLEDFRVFSALGELPPATMDQTPDDLACSNSFKLTKRYAIIYAKTSLQTPISIEALLFKDMVGMAGRCSDRPGYLVFEIVKRETFGVFDLEKTEDDVFCVATGENVPAKLVGASAGFSPMYSLQIPALLILGDLKGYAELEKIPIWPSS